MGIIKRRKQPHIFREGARHAAHDASALNTARDEVQRTAVVTLRSHEHLDYPIFSNEPTAKDDSTDAPTTLSASGPPSIPHPASTLSRSGDAEPIPQQQSNVQSASCHQAIATTDASSTP